MELRANRPIMAKKAKSKMPMHLGFAEPAFPGKVKSRKGKKGKKKMGFKPAI